MTARMLVADGTRGARTIIEHAQPTLPGQLRIAAECSLVSPGTELHYLARGARTGERFPLGYCSAGHVLEVGEGVTGFATGDRVIAMGWGRAVHGDIVTVPYRLCRRVPEGVELTDAVLANLAATAVHAVDRSGLDDDDEVLVVGAGIVGQLVAQVACAQTSRITVLDRNPERLKSVAPLGFGLSTVQQLVTDTETAADASAPTRRVFVCLAGEATEVVAAALSWAIGGSGRPVLVGVGRFTATIDFSVALGNLDLRYAARCGAGYRDEEYAHGRSQLRAPAGESTVDMNLQRALDLVAAGVIRPNRMALISAPLEDAAQVYARLRDDHAVLSALFTYGGAVR